MALPGNFDELLSAIISYLPRTGQVLDAGCGPGMYAGNLKKLNDTILCLDLTKNEKIQENGLPFCLGSITGLPLKSNSVDFIYCLTVLQYIEDDVKAINEFHRILKPGGKVLITVPTRWSPFFLIRELEIYCGVYPWQSSWNIRPYQYYSRSMISRLIKNKFDIIEIRGYLYNFLPRLTGLCLKITKKNRHVNRFFSKITPVIKPQGTVQSSEHAPESASPLTRIYPARKQHISKISDISYHYLVVLEKRR
jgi:SAM-dependent methyltransferase